MYSGTWKTTFYDEDVAFGTLNINSKTGHIKFIYQGSYINGYVCEVTVDPKTVSVGKVIKVKEGLSITIDKFDSNEITGTYRLEYPYDIGNFKAIIPILSQ
jgi:hypothetical protein